MSTIHYTKAHEYIRVEGEVGTVGISDYAQKQLGDIVYVELPETGKSMNQGDEAAVVESVKAASEIYAPVSGEIIEANPELDGYPALVNEDPEGKAWFLKMKISDSGQLDGLMDGDAYAKYVEGLD